MERYLTFILMPANLRLTERINATRYERSSGAYHLEERMFAYSMQPRMTRMAI